MWPTSPEKRDSLLHSASHIRKALLGFLSVSSIGFLWAWRFCGYKTGLLFGNASGTNAQMTPSYLVDSILACITILALPPLLARMSLRGKRMLTIGGAITMSVGTLLTGFATMHGMLSGIVLGGVLSGLGSGVLYVLSGLTYVYETTDRLETVVPLNMVWALPGLFVAPILAGTPGGIVFVAALPLSAGAIIWHGLPRLETAQLPTDMSEMPHLSRRFIATILVCTALFEIAACSRVVSPLIASVTELFGSFAQYYQVVSVITFATLIPASLLLITSSKRFNILSTFRHMVPLLIIAAITNLSVVPSSIQLAGAFVNAFANTYLTLTLYIWSFGLAKRGALSPRWSFSLYMGVMVGGITLGNVVGLLVPTDLPADGTSHIHIFILISLFALVLMILPEKPRAKQTGEPNATAKMPARCTISTSPTATSADMANATSTSTIQTAATGTPDLAPAGTTAPLGKPGNGTTTKNATCSVSGIPEMTAMEEGSSDADRFTALALAHGLTSREIEICLLLAQGRSRPYIREKLVISKSTVDTHARHAYAKLGIHSNQELIDLFESR